MTWVNHMPAPPSEPAYWPMTHYIAALDNRGPLFYYFVGQLTLGPWAEVAAEVIILAYTRRQLRLRAFVEHDQSMTTISG
jgi:hypothetical protein